MKKKLMLIMAISVMLLQGCGAAKTEVSDTERWITASYAVLTEINGWDYTYFPGSTISEIDKMIQQESLKQSWGVEDRESADETLEWVIEEGHRTEFADDMKYLEECGLGEIPAEERVAALLAVFELTEEEAVTYVREYEIYENYGEHAIDAWDYCRALNLMSFYHVAGYYEKEEALDKSLEIAKELQAKYTSWDELMESYLCGYEYWAEESSEERRAIYEELKGRENNPYAVEYNTVLENTWSMK